MNCKRGIIASIAIFVFIFLFDWLFHSTCLKSLYIATANVWRTEEAMNALFAWIMVGNVILSFVFVYIFMKGYEGKGLAEGIRFGVVIALLFAPMNLVSYVVMPIPFKLALYWVLGDLIKYGVCGFLAAVIYKPKEVNG